MDAHIGAVEEPAVEQRLDDGKIGVAQIHVLPDDRDVDGIGRGVDAIDQIRPFAQIGLALDTQMLGEQVVQPLAVEHERDLIDRGGVGSAHHAGDRHVAQQGDLLLEVATDRPIGTAHDRVGLQTQRAHLLDGVLGRLGLELAGGTDERHQRDVHERAAVAADLVAQLPDRLEERQGLDVADRAADLHDLHVRLLRLGKRQDARLDLVGDVRDDLHGLAEVVAPTLLGQHRRVHGAGREVRAAMQIGIEEALVVTEVEVGLGPVVQHEDLAVLEGVHRAGVDVHVRVELLEHDLLTARREEATERCGGDAFAETGGNSARDEYVLRMLPHHGTRL